MRITLLIAFLISSFVSNSQTGTYLEDLKSLQSVIQKTPSYKTQIKGDNLDQYKKLYDHLASDSITDPNSFRYFYNLSQLLFPIRDNHLAFYQIPNFENFKTKESIDSFITTKEFRDYPTVDINFDSLKNELTKKDADSIEGIYHYDKYYTVGLYRSRNNEYLGVILDSDINLWRRGQVAIHLNEFGPQMYKAIYGHPLTKNFIYQPIEKYLNQSLANSYFYGSYSQGIYTKKLPNVDFVNLPRGGSKFGLKDVNKDFQYLLIKTFQADNVTSKTSKKFYDSLITTIKAPYIILDLRNNEGGAEKEMTKYFQLFKKHLENGRLYVLINNGTMSQAEIFAIKLKALNRVITLGQTTRGMLTYGSNYGKRERLPSGRFEFYPTDMLSGQLAYLEYEDYGLKPDIMLESDRDWIIQVLEVQSTDY
jgi:Peptidase family S41